VERTSKTKTCKSVDSRLHLPRPLLKSKLSLTNKLTVYRSIIRPTRLYGIQLWGSAKPSNAKTSQSFRSICLRIITPAPFVCYEQNLHKDLNSQTVNGLAKTHYTKFNSKPQSHPLIKRISTATPIRRRLKWQWARPCHSRDVQRCIWNEVAEESKIEGTYFKVIIINEINSYET